MAWAHVDSDNRRTRKHSEIEELQGETVLFYGSEAPSATDIITDDNFLYLATLQTLDCINKNTGIRVWQYDEYGYSETTQVRLIAVDNGKIYCYYGNKVYCHSTANGEKLWEYTEPGTMDGGVSGVAYNNGAVYCCFMGAYEGSIVKIIDGAKEWGISEDWGLSGGIVDYNYYAISGRNLIAHNVGNGGMIGQVDLSTGITFAGASILGSNGNNIFVLVGALDAEYEVEQSLYCYSLGGTFQWKLLLPSGCTDHAILGENVYLSLEDKLCKVDATGSVEEDADAAYHKIALDDNFLYAINDAAVGIYSHGLEPIKTISTIAQDEVRSFVLDESGIYFVQGDVIGSKVYRVAVQGEGNGEENGEDDTGLVRFELVFGPTTLGLNAKEKRARKLYLIVSKADNARMYVSYSTAPTGPYSDEVSIGKGIALTRAKKALPLRLGGPAGGYVYRVRVRGWGRATVHEIVFAISARR